MPRTLYSPEFKAKIVIEVLEGAKELEAIAADNQLNPNMVRKWKSEFLQNAGKAFEQPDKGTKEARRKERKREKENERLLKKLQIRQSMDGKSRWADNIMIERWFRSLKTDLIYINEFHSPRELRQAIEKYVDEYNTVRPHQSLGNVTPEVMFQSCFQAAS